MAESNRPSSLPQFASTQDLVDFFDTHDMGEFMADMPVAEFEVNLQQRRYLVAIDEALMKTLTVIARTQHVSPEALIDAWLREKATQVTA